MINWPTSCSSMRLLKDAEQTQKDKLHYKQLAKITLSVDAPIADRLGIWLLKSELEDMAFRLLDPKQYKEIGRQLEANKQERRICPQSRNYSCY